MRTIEVDDQTYTHLQRAAGAQGLSIETWLRQNIPAVEGDRRPIEDLSIEERLGRLTSLEAFVDQMNIRSSAPLDWSSDSYYD